MELHFDQELTQVKDMLLRMSGLAEQSVALVLKALVQRDDALARLHGDFLADPTVTDVITFEGGAAFGAAGEVCVSADAAARQRG